MRGYKEESNFMLAALCGILTALALVAMWAYITYFVNFQVGWMAVAVGYIIGYVIRIIGKGTTLGFGVLGAALSLLTCIAGNLFFIIICLSNDEHIPVLEVLKTIDFSSLISFYVQTFHAVDLMFYGIALYEGFKLSIIQFEQEDAVGAAV